MKKKLTKKAKRRAILGCFFAFVFSLIVYQCTKKPDSYYTNLMDAKMSWSEVVGPYSYMESSLMEVEMNEENEHFPLILSQALEKAYGLKSYKGKMDSYKSSAFTAKDQAEGLLSKREKIIYIDGDDASHKEAEKKRSTMIDNLASCYGKQKGFYETVQLKLDTKGEEGEKFEKRIEEAATEAEEKYKEHMASRNSKKVAHLDENSTIDELYAAVRYCLGELDDKIDKAKKMVKDGEWPVVENGVDTVSKYYSSSLRDLNKRIKKVKEFEARLKREGEILKSWVNEDKDKRPDVQLLKQLKELDDFVDDDEAKRCIAGNIELMAQKPAQKVVEQTPKFVIAAMPELTDSLVLHLLKDWLAKQGKTEITVRDSAKGRDVYAGDELQVRVSTVDDVKNPAETMDAKSAALVFRTCRKSDTMLQDRDASMRESVVCLDCVVYYTSDPENTTQTISDVESVSRYFFAPGSSPRVLSDMCGIIPGENDKAGEAKTIEEAIQEAGERLIVGSYHVQHDMLYAKKEAVSLRSMKTGIVLNPVAEPTLLLNEYPLNLVQDIRVVRKSDMDIPEANSFCLYLTDMDAACASVIVDRCYVPVLQTVEKRTEEKVLRSKDIEVKKVLEALDRLAKNKHNSTLEKEFGYALGSEFLLGKYMPYSMHYDVGKSEGATENIVFNCRDCEFHLGVLGKDMLRMLDEHGKIAVVIVGHADVTGISKNNQKLSEKRAKNYVESVLQTDGFLKDDDRRKNLEFDNLNMYWRSDAIWGTNKAGSVYVVTIGCGDKRAEVTEEYVAEQKALREAYNQKPLSEDEVKQLRSDYFRRDRRAQIFVIVPNTKK